MFEDQVKNAKTKAKLNNSKYDCIVGLSGGKDSTYVIHQLKHNYNMRVLTYTFDNGFSTEYAKGSITNAVKKLDVDHISISLKDSELKDLYLKFYKMFNNFCSVCFHLMHYYSHILANQNKIPLIVNGRTKSQIFKEIDNTKLVEPFEISKNLKDFEFQMFKNLTDKFEKFCKFDFLNNVQVTSLSYFIYHEVDEETKMKYLQENLDWIRPKNALKHPDCFAHSMAENLSINKMGYPIRTGEIAFLVRDSKLTKNEADKILKEDMLEFSDIDKKDINKFKKRISLI
jgi:PP-loop superfamily ATP-utilizing enzyme